MKAGDDEMPHSGVYLTIKPHSQIVFTWDSPFSIEGSTVTVELAAVKGGTEVTLTHVKFPSEESRKNHDDGWNNILVALDNTLAA
jgi:uncharacterized protein YndB with AHSA1/START domain